MGFLFVMLKMLCYDTNEKVLVEERENMKCIGKTMLHLFAVLAVMVLALLFALPTGAEDTSTGGITMAQAQEILGIADGSEPYVYEYTTSLGTAFKEIAAQPNGGILLIGKTANFTSTKFTTTVASDKTVIITSYYIGTYGGKIYDTDYRGSGAKLRFNSTSATSFTFGLGINTYIDYLDIVNAKGSANAKITVACDWNDLYIGKNVTCTAPNATASQAFPAIVAGYNRDQYATGADFPAGEVQNITVESGSWSYVAGGDMSTATLGTDAKPLYTVSGEINITLHGGYYYGEYDKDLTTDRYSENSRPSVMVRCFAQYADTSRTHLVIDGGTYQSSIFGYGMAQNPSSSAGNTAAQAGELVIDITGGTIKFSRLRLDTGAWAGDLTDAEVIANIRGAELTQTTFYITAVGLSEDTATVYWYNDGSSALAKRLANANSKPSNAGNYTKIEIAPPRLTAGTTSTAYNGETNAIRFITTLHVGTMEIEYYGLFVAPFDADVTGDTAKLLRAQCDDISEADENRILKYAVTLVDIPAEKADAKIYAWAFVKLAGADDMIVMPYTPVSVNEIAAAAE